MDLPEGLSYIEYVERKKYFSLNLPKFKYLPPEKQALLIFLSFDYTQDEIAIYFNVDQSTICRWVQVFENLFKNHA